MSLPSLVSLIRILLLGLIFLSKNSAKTSVPLFYTEILSFYFFLSYYLIYYVICEKSSPDFYHTPSHPINKNSSPYFLSIYFISGIHVIGCLWKGKPGVFLCPKSPIDLVKFNPLTLPPTMVAPAFSILSFSMGF